MASAQKGDPAPTLGATLGNEGNVARFLENLRTGFQRGIPKKRTSDEPLPVQPKVETLLTAYVNAIVLEVLLSAMQSPVALVVYTLEYVVEHASHAEIEQRAFIQNRVDAKAKGVKYTDKVISGWFARQESPIKDAGKLGKFTLTREPNDIAVLTHTSGTTHLHAPGRIMDALECIANIQNLREIILQAVIASRKKRLIDLRHDDDVAFCRHLSSFERVQETVNALWGDLCFLMEF